MAEISQYTFSLREVAAALAKQQNIHEGKWMLAIEFNVGIGLFANQPQQPQQGARPGAMMLVDKIQLVRANPTSPADLVFDAAELNKALG